LQNDEPCRAGDLTWRSPVLHSPADRDDEETNVVTTYEVQGRRTERDPDGKPREIVRLDSAQSRATAFSIAAAMGAEKLTAWVFEAQRRAGRTSYKLLGVVSAES
jgi:hypothetical protein